MLGPNLSNSKAPQITHSISSLILIYYYLRYDFIFQILTIYPPIPRKYFFLGIGPRYPEFWPESQDLMNIYGQYRCHLKANETSGQIFGQIFGCRKIVLYSSPQNTCQIIFDIDFVDLAITQVVNHPPPYLYETYRYIWTFLGEVPEGGCCYIPD